MRSLRLLGAATAAIAIATGCGGDDAERAVPPAPTPASDEKASQFGAPDEGEPDYAGLGTWWRELPDGDRLASAALFIEDNPTECAGVRPVDLERQTGIAYGYDFPDAAPTAEVMLETCALLNDGA